MPLLEADRHRANGNAAPTSLESDMVKDGRTRKTSNPSGWQPQQDPQQAPQVQPTAQQQRPMGNAPFGDMNDNSFDINEALKSFDFDSFIHDIGDDNSGFGSLVGFDDFATGAEMIAAPMANEVKNTKNRVRPSSQAFAEDSSGAEGNGEEGQPAASEPDSDTERVDWQGNSVRGDKVYVLGTEEQRRKAKARLLPQAPANSMLFEEAQRNELAPSSRPSRFSHQQHSFQVSDLEPVNPSESETEYKNTKDASTGSCPEPEDARVSNNTLETQSMPAQRSTLSTETIHDTVSKWVDHSSITGIRSLDHMLYDSEINDSISPPIDADIADESGIQVLSKSWLQTTRSPVGNGESMLDSDDETDRLSAASLAESIFSEASFASSATDFSAVSDYSRKQIETATRELLRVFVEDPDLILSYKRAIAHPRIGPERLQRNIHRLLKTFSRDLQSEADEGLETLAARLVSWKASYVALSIKDMFEVKLPNPCVGVEVPDDSSEDEEGHDGEDRVRGLIVEDPVDEDLIEDLDAFRRFLVAGEAFTTFRQKLKVFTEPKLRTVPSDPQTMAPIEELVAVSVPEDVECLTTEIPQPKLSPGLRANAQSSLLSLVVAVGLLEPPLQAGWIRLRWQCVSPSIDSEIHSCG